jgi:hypothetical protein
MAATLALIAVMLPSRAALHGGIWPSGTVFVVLLTASGLPFRHASLAGLK